MASAPATAPPRSRGASRSLSAGISLDLSATRLWVRAVPAARPGAARRWGAGLEPVRAPRMVLPSTAITVLPPMAPVRVKNQEAGAGVEVARVQVLQDPPDRRLRRQGPPLLQAQGAVGQQDHAGAGAVGGQSGAQEGPQGLEHAEAGQQGAHGGGLPAGQDNAVKPLPRGVPQVAGAAHGHGAGARGLEGQGVLAHVPLEGQDADGGPGARRGGCGEEGARVERVHGLGGDTVHGFLPVLTVTGHDVARPPPDRVPPAATWARSSASGGSVRSRGLPSQPARREPTSPGTALG